MSHIQLQVSPLSNEKIQWDLIVKKISERFPELNTTELSVKQFTAGYSNLTYLLSFPDKEMVLRRPPFGYIPPKAHDMEREFRILTKIHPYFPLAPEPFLYVDDPVVTDKHFYIMEKKAGIVLDDEIPSDIQDEQNFGLKVSTALIDTLVQLHRIDINKSNLIELGKPEGYLKRQVEGWMKRYQSSKVDKHPQVEPLMRWLSEHIPTSQAATVVHNDMKLNNMMLSRDDLSKAVAVFDWELCSIGDPLSDLAGSIAYWTEAGDKETGLTSVTHLEGFLSRAELIEQYAKKTGRDVSNIDYYLTFAFFKIAVILQQIYYRFKNGEIEDDRFSHLNIGIENLINQAIKAKNHQLL